MTNIEFFASLLLDSTTLALNKIQTLSKVKQNLENTNLYKTMKIIEECYNLEKMVNALPEDIFKTNLKKLFSLELPKYTCYTIDKDSQINCLDFYNNYLKRKEVHSQILNTVKKQEGGMGGIMLTAAITALAILNASVSVTASVFNSDKFVAQQLAKRGIDPNASEEEPPSFYNSVKKTVLSVFSKSEPNPSVLSEDEVYRYNELELNIAGKCAYLAYIAELCTGGCPTEEEWLKRDPNIVDKIINSQTVRDEHRMTQMSFLNSRYSDFTVGNAVGTLHMIGVGLSEKYATNVPEESKRDPEWFREYFSSGDTNYKKGDKSDVAIATIFIPGHQLNMLYNRNTQKLCIHEVNHDAGFLLPSKLKKLPSYICEKGFFTKEQLHKLNKSDNNYSIVKVVKAGKNIIRSYENMLEENGIEINFITPSEKIFIHDNENNTGSIREYINIHERVNDMIIEGQREAFKIMKKNEDKWVLDPDELDTFDYLVSNTEGILQNPSKIGEYSEKRNLLHKHRIAQNIKNYPHYQSERDKFQETAKKNYIEYMKKTSALVPYEEPEKHGGKRNTKHQNRKSRRHRTYKKKRQ